LDEMVASYPVLSEIQDDVRKAYEVMRDSYRNGGKLLICGNGGSAGASDHIACELLKTMELKRPLNTAQRKMIMERYPEEGAWLADNLTQGLPTISLLGHAAFLSAMDNDVNSDLAYAQAVFSLGKPGDVLLAISTSGKAKKCKKCSACGQCHWHAHNRADRPAAARPEGFVRGSHLRPGRKFGACAGTAFTNLSCFMPLA
jgi:Phosphoheptose isomerase